VNHDEAHRDHIEWQLPGECPFTTVQDEGDGKDREKAGTACPHCLWNKKQQPSNCLNGCEYGDMNVDAIPACRERVPSCLNAVHD